MTRYQQLDLSIREFANVGQTMDRTHQRPAIIQKLHLLECSLTQFRQYLDWHETAVRDSILIVGQLVIGVQELCD